MAKTLAANEKNDETKGLPTLRRNKRRSATRHIARAAVIAALYVVLTLIAAPISYGPVQFRISEAMVILPLLMPEAIAGLTVGCLIANMISTPWDMLIGTLATLIAAILTYACGRIKAPYLGWIPPVILNALLVPVVFILTDIPGAYWFNMLTVGAGELAVSVVLGIPLYIGLKNVRRRHPTLFN